MFISDRLVYVELHKTGCTHIRELLTSLLHGVLIGKHNPPPPALLAKGRRFLGSVRNPWDWYVSLWAYGCEKKGLVYERLTQASNRDAARPQTAGVDEGKPATATSTTRRAKEWMRCYSDVHSTSAFQDWLHMIHDKDYWNDLGENYGNNPVASISGFLTYRYLYLFCRHQNFGILTLDGLKKYDADNCFIDSFVRMERLEDDFIQAMQAFGIRLSDTQVNLIRSSGKTNMSSKRIDTASYYDEESLRLVQQREQLIIQKFSYVPPEQ